MHLVLDIGNTALKIGCFQAGELAALHRVVGTAWAPRADALRAVIAQQAVEGVAIVSVVPSQTSTAAELLGAHGVADILVAGPTTPLPFAMGYATPDTLGADRLAAAAGAWQGWHQTATTMLVVDAGTAITYEVIAEGVYRGGAIAAGPALLQRALHEGTAQLPDVPMEAPAYALGTSTREAIQSGLYHQFIDSVDGMVDRLKRTTPGPHAVVVTGGWGETLYEAMPALEHHAPHLVLEGGRALLAWAQPPSN